MTSNYTPTPEQIAEACHELQLTWSAPEERQHRTGTARRPDWTPPAVMEFPTDFDVGNI